MPAPTIDLNFQITAASWKKIPRLRQKLQAAAQATAENLPRALRFPATATILLCGDAKIQQLNHDFRGINKPTNVLSFPQFEPEDIYRAIKPRQKISVELGDIAIAHRYTVAEAKREKKKIIDHVTHLAVHGLLHLTGYDHLSPQDAKKMESLEKKILKIMGLPDPYA